MTGDDIYTARLKALLLRTRPRLTNRYELSFKACFGAIAGYVDGNIFVTSGRFGIALKLPPQSVQRLLEEPGAKPLRYFPKGHVKRDYVVVPASVLDDGPAIKKLVGQSIRYATRPAV